MSNDRAATPPPAERLPRHIGIIMDGNGRWAKLRGLPREAGHKQGSEVFTHIARYCKQIGIEVLTVYAFSTENWKRPQHEVDAIMQMLQNYLANADRYRKEQIRLRVIGDRSVLSESLQKAIAHAEEESRDFTAMTVNLAVNYGGREEILHAARMAAARCVSGELCPQELTEEFFAENIYTAGQPEVDLIIRPSGELRLSNFLLWQSAYAEFVFMDILWPDFTPDHLNEALWQYADRNRRFGGV